MGVNSSFSDLTERSEYRYERLAELTELLGTGNTPVNTPGYAAKSHPTEHNR